MAYGARIKKDRMEVVIRTDREKIEGVIHKLPEKRLLDMLNKGEDRFIAVSDASVYSLETGGLDFQSSFLAVNVDQIVLIAETYTIPTT